MKEENKIVHVSWIDSMQTNGWGNEQSAIGADMNCESVGFLVDHTEQHVVLALNSSAYSKGDFITIPIVSVVEINEIIFT